MPGDLSAAVDVDDRSAVHRAVQRLGALAGRIDARVLEQQHGAGFGAGDDGLVQTPLLVPGGAVLDDTGPYHRKPRQGVGHAASVARVGRASPPRIRRGKGRRRQASSGMRRWATASSNSSTSSTSAPDCWATRLRSVLA